MRQICRSYKQWFTHFLQCRMWVFWLPMGSSVWTERSDLHLSLSRRLQFHSWHRMEYGEQLPLTPDLNSLLHVFEFLFFCVCVFVRHSTTVHVSRAGEWVLGTPLLCLDSVHEKAAVLQCSTSIWHYSLSPSLRTLWALFPSSSYHWGSV